MGFIVLPPALLSTCVRLRTASFVYYTDVLLPLLSGNIATTQANRTGRISRAATDDKDGVQKAVSFAKELLNSLQY